jgi:guanylate cyclase
VTSLRALLDRALVRLARVGAVAADDEETRLRKALLVLISVLVWPISIVWATLFIVLGSWTGLFAAAYFIISVASVALFARTRNAGLFLRIQLLDILISPTISMVPLGGFLGSGAVGLWGLLAPLGALVFGGVRSGVRWYVAFVAMFLGSGILGSVVGPVAPVPGWFANVILGLNVAVGGTVFFTLLALFATQRRDALGALRSEQERAENLLLNILPASIAKRLKASPTTIADQFDVVSVLFADVVDFTPRAERMSAAEVVGTLDRLFSHFDTLAEQYDLEKIKTIGDAYMVAAGVPEPRPDHATALAKLALDMISCVEPSGDVGDLGLTLRIGINSGPVVAGVIGRKKFLYDLWGDAVNIASRMESQGTPGRIQITEPTHELLGAEFDCEPRGTISIKGKGDMETWYLIGLQEAVPGHPGSLMDSGVNP